MVKHRTSIEFPPELWKRLSSTVPDRKKGSFIIEAVKEKLSRETIKALILCGGQGTRMRPLTLNVPKAMLPIGYKPVLEHMISYLKQQGIYNIILAVGYLGEQIIKYFNDGSKFGVNIEYLTETIPLGTGGAIKNSESLINSTFIVLNGDVVLNSLDIKDILAFHREKNALATVALHEVKDSSRFGLAKLDDTNKIVEFLEKPKHPVPGWVNAGLYVFEPEIFKLIPKNKTISLEQEIFPKILEKGKMFGYQYNGYWSDLGLPEDYEKVCKDFFVQKIF